jgi:tetratricopeptide (TPR) repeat protein
MNALSVNIKCLLHIALITFIALHTQTIKANTDSLKYAKDYAKAKQYLTEGKKQKALKSLSKLVSENSFRPEASLLIAHVHENDKNYTEAAKYFTLALRAKPKDALLYFSRGNCYFALKKFNLAVADYNTTIRYDSLFLGAYNNMALVRIFNQGNSKENIREEDFRIARDNIKKFEQKGDIIDTQVLQNLGLIYLYLFDFKSSENYFNRIIFIDSTNANAHFYKGLCNYYLRAFDIALISFKKANDYHYENKNQLEEFISFTTFVIEQMKLPENKKQ